MADISKIQLPSGGTYNIKDASSIHAPSSPSAGDVLTWSGSAWTASQPSSDIYYIDTDSSHIPTNSIDDIKAAINSGKTIIVRSSGTYSYFIYEKKIVESTTVLMGGRVERYSSSTILLETRTFQHDGTSWTVLRTTTQLPKDVIAAPSSPTSGDVLTYNNGSWVAMAPGVNVYIGTTAPSGATTGTLWLDTSDDESLSTSVSSVEELAGGA